MIEIFARWGKAGCFRVDNGEPFGSALINPTPPLALWLIAHDIDLTWNKLYCPQMNNRVEKIRTADAARYHPAMGRSQQM